jgi:hypothetical protein
MRIINVNLMQHGDGKQVYISIMTEDGEIVIRGDRIAVHVDRNLPDPLNPDSQVSVWQDARNVLKS